MSEPRAEYTAGSPSRVVEPELVYIAEPVLRELRKCEAWPVIGMEHYVDVRVPKALWELIRG